MISFDIQSTSIMNRFLLIYSGKLRGPASDSQDSGAGSSVHRYKDEMLLEPCNAGDLQGYTQGCAVPELEPSLGICLPYYNTS